jgi:ABC-type dipeptide/oligopeptide/nickel transport system ATPase component
VPALLEVRDLVVRYEPPVGPPVLAVDGLDLEIHEREAVGVVGESGSGKTTVLLATLGLLPPGARVVRGSVRWRGRDLLALGERQLRAVRGAEVSVVFQDPALALNPFRRVGPQIAEVIQAHERCSAAERRVRSLQALEAVHLADPSAVHDAYPHELSGGQRQRIAIAQALVCRPALLLADEPTASLDSVTQAEIRALLVDLRRRTGLSVLLVSHELRSVAALADRVVVLHAGRAVEAGPAAQVFGAPVHPYTRGLLAASPRALIADPAVPWAAAAGRAHGA